MQYHDQVLDLSGKSVTIARIISRLTPAPLFNLYIASILAYTSPIGIGPVLTPVELVMISLILMVIFPILPIIVQAQKGKVDLDVSIRGHRTRFFLFSILCYICSAIVFYYFECEVMVILAIAYTMVTSAVTTANHFTKISVHAAGVGGPSLAMIYMYGPPALIAVIVWILVIWSRITLKQHTFRQGLAGLFIGIVVTFGVYFILFP